MDPTSFGFVAVIAILITVISIIVFKMYPKETDFEQAYGKNALRLLTEDRAIKAKNVKHKNKWKNAEKKKDFGAEEKQNRSEEPPNDDLLYAPLSTNGYCGTEQCGEAYGKGNNRKRHDRQLAANSEIKQPTESVKDEKISVAKSIDSLLEEKLNDEREVTSTAKVLHDENRVGERKAKKKNRGRRSDQHVQEIAKEGVRGTEEIISAAEEIELLQSVEKKLEKIKPEKANSFKDLNVNKLQERLNIVEELEPEYIMFLTNYVSSVNAQKAKLENEIASIKKQIVDKDRFVLQCTNKLTAAEQKDSQIAVLQKALAEEKRKYKLFEETVCTQLSNNMQEKSFLQRKYDQLQGEFGALRNEMKKAQSVIRSAPPSVDTKSYQQQIDRLKAELTSSKNHCSQQELELNQRLQALQQIRKELQNQDCQIEHLTKTNALLEKRLRDVEDNAKSERDTIEMKLQNTMKVAEELSVVTTEMRSGMLQQKENVEIAVQEREKYCEQIHILNAQLMDVNRERVKYSNDCAAYSKRLIEMENANAELRNQLETLKRANATNDANQSGLTEEVGKYRKQLVDIVEARDRDIAKLKDKLQCIEEEENYVKQMSVDISNEAIELAKCRKELTEFRSDYNEKLNLIVSLEKELAKHKIKTERETLLTSCNDAGMNANEEMMKCKVHSTSRDDVCDYNVNSEVSELKKQNEELRETNYKIVEISQQQENIFKKHLEEVEKNHAKALQQYCFNVFNTLCAIAPPETKLPNLPIIHNVNHFHKWLKDVENVVLEINNQSNNDGHDKTENKENLTKLGELEASNRRYRVALINLSSHIDKIEQEVILKERLHFSEISRLRHGINEQLKKQLENEHKRKLGLISQASKLCELMNGPQKFCIREAEPHFRKENAYDGADCD